MEKDRIKQTSQLLVSMASDPLLTTKQSIQHTRAKMLMKIWAQQRNVSGSTRPVPAMAGSPIQSLTVTYSLKIIK